MLLAERWGCGRLTEERVEHCGVYARQCVDGQQQRRVPLVDVFQTHWRRRRHGAIWSFQEQLEITARCTARVVCHRWHLQWARHATFTITHTQSFIIIYIYANLTTMNQHTTKWSSFQVTVVVLCTKSCEEFKTNTQATLHFRIPRLNKISEEIETRLKRQEVKNWPADWKSAISFISRYSSALILNAWHLLTKLFTDSANCSVGNSPASADIVHPPVTTDVTASCCTAPPCPHCTQQLFTDHWPIYSSVNYITQ